MEYEEPRWLRLKLDRDEKAAEQARKAEAEARRRWQMWCPFCERDTEHVTPSSVSRKEQNTNVLCVRCRRLHAGRARRPHLN